MSEVRKVTVRFRMDQERDRRAYDLLTSEGKDTYHSLSSALIAAAEGFFSRQKQIRDDPYLETREKEDALLSKIVKTVWDSVQNSLLGCLPLLMQNSMTTQPAANVNDAESETEEYADLDAALDFIDSL